MTTANRVMTLRLPDEVHERLRRLAFERRISINALVTGYVMAGMEAEEDGT
ncbi:MAG TPA: toxin-antitoxin system HicB family antitoxin [Streptosporangiaceae bacterium]|nr:toxin-antitoxin system HicB family antitoxin [Streptosporangiaceae bacterium]